MQDYKEYTYAELEDTLKIMNKEKYPSRFEALSAELALRQAGQKDDYAQQKKGAQDFPNSKANLHKNTQRVLGFIPIMGGVLGILAISQTFSFDLSILNILILLCFIGLYVYSIICGVLLLEKTTLAVLDLNRLLWAIQIPVFIIPLIGYQFFSGVFAVLLFQFSSFDFTFNFSIISSSFNFTILQIGLPNLVGINIVAVGFYYFFSRKIKDTIAQNEKDTKMSHNPDLE